MDEPVMIEPIENGFLITKMSQEKISREYRESIGDALDCAEKLLMNKE